MISFLLLIVLSISLYPGGTIKQHRTEGYTFSENYLSDLGKTITPSEENNMKSMVLFICALASISLSMIGFFYGSFRYFKGIFPTGDITLGIGTVLFILSFIFLLGVGFTPANITLNFHIFFAVWFFRLVFFAALFHTIAFFRMDSSTIKHAIGFGLISLSTSIYILFSDFNLGGLFYTDTFKPDVISQKFIVIYLILGTGMVGIFNNRFIKQHSE
ncbi:MAG: hypothetical protein HOD97_04980 [Candidatus Marinimicrobia bacterium]|nr:hypothetical protein [Candidatus Neomarinimicrobiota bacterium]MBT3617431.1 hypothetical protein [Candidatus Neomarinimicrobiota bacterium]MBT3829371.1 hypothetical protein [Candidatus Neomarinimicrobiota bacterium]MBT3997654.1 hypothetical protein [Candidatus Neomarinimicrobiota bacterium]MBT4280952.1 hypothetical protein [Candidatus Neomarinimicrobiota bacterium]